MTDVEILSYDRGMHMDLDASDGYRCIHFFNCRVFTPDLGNTLLSMTKVIPIHLNHRKMPAKTS